MFQAIEYFGRGDPFFGGDADDRPLGRDGRFMRAPYGVGEIAEFDTREAAEAAAAAAPKRAGGHVAIHDGQRGRPQWITNGF